MGRKGTSSRPPKKTRAPRREKSQSTNKRKVLDSLGLDVLGLMEKIQDSIVILDPQGHFIYANQAAEKRAGISMETFVRLHYEDLVCAQYHDTVRKNLEALLAGEPVEPYELEYRRPDGSTRWVETFVRTVSTDGHVSGFMAISRDLGARKKAEAALSASEEKYRSLVERSTDGIAVAQEGLVKYANQSLSEMTGYDLGEVLDRSFLFLIHEDEREETAQLYARRLAGKSLPTRVERTLRHKQGWRIETEVDIGPISFDGKLAHLVIIRDISDRKQAEKALRESTERYRAVVEDQTELVCRFSPDGKLTFVNQAYCRYFEKEVGELVGTRFLPLVTEEDRKSLQEHLAGFGPDNPSGTIEHRVIAPSGETRWQQWSNRAIFNGTGSLVEFQGVGRDITDRKEAEIALKKVQENLEEVVRERTRELYRINEDLQREIVVREWTEKTLREQKLRNDVILETALDGFCIVDVSGKIVMANAALCRILNYGDDELVGVNVKDLEVPMAPTCFSRQLKRVMDQGHGRYDVTCRQKNGGFVDLEISSNFVKIGQDRFFFSFFKDVSARNKTLTVLKEREAALKIQARELRDVNNALRVLLKRAGASQKEVEERVMLNFRQLVLPYLDRLEKTSLDDHQQTCINVLKTNLDDIISSFTLDLSSKYLGLTPAELQIAGLIKGGKTTKEIADLLNLSPRTVEGHRQSIRSKIGVKNKKANLRSLLLSM